MAELVRRHCWESGRLLVCYFLSISHGTVLRLFGCSGSTGVTDGGTIGGTTGTGGVSGTERSCSARP
jgi:hypothetical protein